MTPQARVERGESLAGDWLTKIYCELLKRHHGASEGAVAIDDVYRVECEAIVVQRN